jgi:hypothetical protein
MATAAAMVRLYYADKPKHPFDRGATPNTNLIMIGGTAPDLSPRVCQHRSSRPRLMLLPMPLFKDRPACGSETPNTTRPRKEGQWQQQQS